MIAMGSRFLKLVKIVRVREIYNLMIQKLASWLQFTKTVIFIIMVMISQINIPYTGQKSM